MTDAETTPPADAPAAADGVRLAELADELPLSRASVFEVVKALGIRTTKGPGPSGRGRVSWISSADADRIQQAAHAVHRGEVRIADLGRPVAAPARALRAPSAPSAMPPDPGPFLARMEAAEAAIRSGLGLTSAEAAWILGVAPTARVGEAMIRGGIRAVHCGANVWRLQRVDQ